MKPMERRFVYMDYNATTPLRPEVKAEMIEDLELYANASSLHEAGRKARSRIERSRAAVAALIGAKDPERVVFTSGGSVITSYSIHYTKLYESGRSP